VETIETFNTLIPALLIFFAIFAAVVLLGGGIILAIIRQFVPKLADSVPSDIGERTAAATERILLLALNMGAAKTKTLDDDETLISLLRLTGAEVTGSPETGYTIVVAAKPENAQG